MSCLIPYNVLKQGLFICTYIYLYLISRSQQIISLGLKYVKIAKRGRYESLRLPTLQFARFSFFSFFFLFLLFDLLLIELPLINRTSHIRLSKIIQVDSIHPGTGIVLRAGHCYMFVDILHIFRALIQFQFCAPTILVPDAETYLRTLL